MKLHGKLSEYLDQIGAGRVSLQPRPEAGRALPLFLGQAYDVYAATIFGKVQIFLLARTLDRPTPAQAVKHIEVARKRLGSGVVFVFSEMPSFDRKRFVEKGVPFIVPGKQTFLPMALVDLRESGGRAVVVAHGNTEDLSGPAQSVLLYYLQRPDAHRWSLNQWAAALGCSPSTMTRVRTEFAQHELCDEVGHGRALLLVFPEDRRDLWGRIEQRLVSPVRAAHHVVLQRRAGASQLLRAGFSALADMSMLTDPPEDVYAVHSPRFRALLTAGAMTELPSATEESVVVERWRYDPVPLSADGERVDRLSLLLSLRDSHDERVQIALDEVLKGMPW
jgi:hypothetical protein